LRLLLDPNLSPKRIGGPLAHHEFGAIIRGVTRLLKDRPDPDQWRDLSIAL
jgi:hypothetical protein